MQLTILLLKLFTVLPLVFGAPIAFKGTGLLFTVRIKLIDL